MVQYKIVTGRNIEEKENKRKSNLTIKLTVLIYCHCRNISYSKAKTLIFILQENDFIKTVTQFGLLYIHTYAKR